MTPRENPSFFGHAPALATLRAAMAGTRLHHAWIIAGPEGVGKATLAYRLARRLLKGGGAGQDIALDPADPVFRRVAAGTHADLMSIEREWDEKKKRLKKNIAADSARAIAPFLRLTPAEGGARVVIVDGAEDMNKESANALLKILEEPPPRAYLFLITAAPGRLLPTVRSRCRMLTLGRLEDDDLLAALHAAGQDPGPDRTRVLALARGAPGRAVQLLRDGGLSIAGLVDEVMAALPSIDLARGYQIADQLRDEAPFALFMGMLAERIAQTASQSAGTAGTHQPGPWAEAWAGLRRIEAETEGANLDRRQAVIATLALLRGASRPAA